ncbi:lonely Cys domain-containing protein, partial [Streptomyces sp. SID7982]|nr:lonely Cys domain-containing protein [Streptomyces sp. SID7982]
MALGVGPQGTGPLTWRELTRITDDFARRAGYSGGVVTHTLLRDVLLAARHRTLRLPGLPNMPNILYAPPAQADPAASVAEEPPPVRIDTASADADRGPSPAPPAALAPDTEFSGGPDTKAEGSRPDVPWSPGPLPPGTVPPGTEAAYRRALTDALGQGVTADPGFSQWLAGAARLDLLRRTSADPALRGRPLDLDAVARKVLSLAPDTPVTGSDYGNLFRITLDPRTTDATGLATLAALNLVDRGALSRESELAAHDGTPYGRLWSASRPAPGQVVDVHEVATTLLNDDGTMRETDRRPSPWQPQPGRRPPFVLVAAGHARTIMVGLDDGSQAEAAQDVVTELLAMDPVLSGLPEDVPVLLAVPYAGEGGLELPRGLADGLGREVWSTSGTVHLTPRGDRIDISLLHEVDRQGDPVAPRGDFIRSRPGEVSAHDPADVPAWERHLVSFTVVSDEDGHPQVGRVYLDADDLARRERHARVVHRMNRLVRVLPGSDLAFPPVPISGGAAPGEKAHHLVLHHLPEAAAMPQEDGSTYRASPAETVRALRRRPSVQRLGSRDWIYTFACWAGRAYDGPLPSPATNIA